MKSGSCWRSIAFGVSFLLSFLQVEGAVHAEQQTSKQVEIPLGIVYKCLSEVNLGIEQRSAIYDFLKEQQLEIDNLMTELKRKREELELVGNSIDRQTIKSRRNEIVNLNMEVKNKRISVIEKVGEMLTNEQRELFNKCLQERIDRRGNLQNRRHEEKKN